MLDLLRSWRNTAYLLWTIKMQRRYLRAIMRQSKDPFAITLAMAGYARSRSHEARLKRLVE